MVTVSSAPIFYLLTRKQNNATTAMATITTPAHRVLVWVDDVAKMHAAAMASFYLVSNSVMTVMRAIPMRALLAKKGPARMLSVATAFFGPMAPTPRSAKLASDVLPGPATAIYRIVIVFDRGNT